MNKVRITVLKCFTKEEIFGDDIPEDIVDSVTPCEALSPGQEFVIESMVCPPGFCNWAFGDIYRDVAQLMMGGDFPFIGRPGVMFSSCTDGKRPVIFRLERLDE